MKTSASWPMSAAAGVQMGLVEIRIQMDRVDPPAGRLSVVAGPGRGPGRSAREIWFTGWLGLLRALPEATGAPGAGPGPER